MIYRLQVWWIRLLNLLPKRVNLIKRVSSLEWEQQQIIDHVLGVHMYEPGAWWRLRKLGSA